jgi:hypothetical protein
MRPAAILPTTHGESFEALTTSPHSLRTAIDHLAAGDWQAAHAIVQEDESPEGCWLHGIVHLLEGDVPNARYWYARAGRTLSLETEKEIAAARKSIA